MIKIYAKEIIKGLLRTAIEHEFDEMSNSCTDRMSVVLSRNEFFGRKTRRSRMCVLAHPWTMASRVGSESKFASKNWQGGQFRTPTDGREIKQKQVCVTNLQSSWVHGCTPSKRTRMSVVPCRSEFAVRKLTFSGCHGGHPLNSVTGLQR